MSFGQDKAGGSNNYMARCHKIRMLTVIMWAKQKRVAASRFSLRRRHGGGMLGTVRHASESRQLQNVRSVMRRCESQKGNFYHDVGHVSREER